MLAADGHRRVHEESAERQLVWGPGGFWPRAARWVSPRGRPGAKVSSATDWWTVCSHGKVVREWVKQDGPGEKPSRVHLQVGSQAQPGPRGVRERETPSGLSHPSVSRQSLALGWG